MHPLPSSRTASVSQACRYAYDSAVGLKNAAGQSWDDAMHAAYRGWESTKAGGQQTWDEVGEGHGVSRYRGWGPPACDVEEFVLNLTNQRSNAPRQKTSEVATLCSRAARQQGRAAASACWLSLRLSADDALTKKAFYLVPSSAQAVCKCPKRLSLQDFVRCCSTSRQVARC